MTTADQQPPITPIIDWDACLAEHQPWLKRVILARTGEAHAVEEVWQQVALAAVEQRWPLTDPAKVAPWLHRLAVIAAARYRRGLGRNRRAIESLARCRTEEGCAEHSPDPLNLLLQQERVELTRRAIRAMTPRDAEMLIMKYGERLSYRQIASYLGITEKAVDGRLQRAREQLRGALTNLGLESSEL